jgi:hypothetical protein
VSLMSLVSLDLGACRKTLSKAKTN